MSSQYETPNYPLRPAKRVQRKMLCEAFARLGQFAPLNRYRYVGFGAAYFTDFILLHKVLGVHDMVSIEREAEGRGRFLFNRPYRCVEIEFGKSTAVLPRLCWQKRSIVWLDYNDRLDDDILEDVTHVFGRIHDGSVVAITVNAHPLPWRPGGKERLEDLRNRVGKHRVPGRVKQSDLREWGTASVSRAIIDEEIKRAIADRNGLRPAGSRFMYKQLFNFRYADGERMLTVGGIVYREDQSRALASCGFEDLSFVRTDEQPFEIYVPNLTYLERRALDSGLPRDGAEQMPLDWIPEREREAYARCYRYYPTFAETEL